MNKKLVFVVSFILFTLSLACAMPYTIMGNINAPDAYILPNKMVDVGFINYFAYDAMVETDADEDTLSTSISDQVDDIDFGGYLRYGLMDRAEVALYYASTAGLYGEAKVRLIVETESLPALSIGVANLFSEVDDTDKNEVDEFPDRQDYIKNSPYIVVSKSLVIVTGIPGFDYLETSFHGGIGTRRFAGKGSLTENASGLFWSTDIKPSKYWGMNIEFDSQNINIGANVYYKNFALRVGMYELEDYFGIKGDKSSNIFAANLVYTLDQFSDIKISEQRNKVIAPKAITSTTAKPSPQSYEEGSNPLREELELIRQRRKQAEKELEEIRKLLQD